MIRKFGTIYIIKNKINNKLYVGQTGNWKQRFKRHRNGKLYIDRSMRKNGYENFEFYFLNDVPIKLWDYFEKKLIKQLNTIFPNGYNLNSGGNKNKFYSDVSKKKMSKNRKNKYKGKDHHDARKIICLNTLEVFDTITEASIKLNINLESICVCCQNKHLSSGKTKEGIKLVWCYYEDYLKMTKDEIKNKIEKAQDAFKGINNPNYGKHHTEEAKEKNRQAHIGKKSKDSFAGKSIICLNNLKIFDTLTEASIYYRINIGSISFCCQGKLKSAGKDSDRNKLHWMYYSDYKKMIN